MNNNTIQTTTSLGLMSQIIKNSQEQMLSGGNFFYGTDRREEPSKPLRRTRFFDPDSVRILDHPKWGWDNSWGPKAPAPLRSDTASRKGLEALTLQAQEEFEEKTGASLPYNWYYHGPAVGKSQKGFFPRYPWEGVDLVEVYARAAGWVRAITHNRYPAIMKVIAKGSSPNGMNSPRTVVSPWGLSQIGSPGFLERKLWKVKRRAEEILRPWGVEEGLHPSWVDIAQTLSEGRRATGKVAVIVAAKALSRFGSHLMGEDPIYGECPFTKRNGGRKTGLKEARFILQGSRGLKNLLLLSKEEQVLILKRVSWMVGISIQEAIDMGQWQKDYSDGVGMVIDMLRCETKHGISKKFGVICGSEETATLVRHEKSGRTFHGGNRWHPRGAIGEALDAWKKQKELLKKESDLVGFLTGEWGFCPLLTRDDSYRSGNCESGTEAWLKKVGLQTLHLIPGHLLLNHLHNEEVRRVAQTAYEAFRHLKSEAA